MYVKREALIMLALASGGALLTGCSATPNGDLPRPRNLVLVTLDTTRADHLSAYGYDLATSPWLEQLATQGVAFDRAYAQSATTKPSHATLFTSLYPIQHGVQNNGLVLEDRFVTMAEVLSAAGFRTAAFVSADAPLGGNLGQGFEVWNEPDASDQTNDRGRKAYRPAADTVDSALSWLDTRSDDAPLFLWLHVYDAHKPLDPPERTRAEISRLLDERGQEAHKNQLEAQGIPAMTHDGFYEQTLDYDAEVLYADSELGRLFAQLHGTSLGDDALWIVTADHGEGLGSHGRWGHSVHIYNAQLHVPLVMWLGADVLAPRRVADTVVELTDVLPTVTEIFELGPVEQPLPMQGKSLVPYLRGERPRERRLFAYSERSRYVDAKRHRQSKGNYEPGSRYSLQDMRYKYLLFTEGSDELYDLAADSAEGVDLIAAPEHAEARDQMRDLLAELVASVESGASPERVSEAEVERLRALGYIQ